MELLYIIRNNEKNNHSILGVYTSAKAAKKAIEYNEKLLLEGDFRRYEELSREERREARAGSIDYIPRKEVKVVLANGLQYRGCSAYPIELLLEDPEQFEKSVKEWFDNMSSWSETTDNID